MVYFEILQIAPTTDVKEIKKAYSRLLKIYHPEEKPQEYMSIHQAYKAALQYARLSSQQIIQTKEDKNEKDLGNQHQFQLIDQEMNYNDSLETEEHVFVHESYDNQFDKLFDEYEQDLKQRQKEIVSIMNQLIIYHNQLETPPKSFFYSEMFQKYYRDDDFIEWYVDTIVKGIYSNINEIERKRLKKIHKQLYFSTKEEQEKNELLYNALYPYILSENGSGLEIIFIIGCFLMNILLLSNDIGDLFYILYPFEILLIFVFALFISSAHKRYDQDVSKIYIWIHHFIVFFFVSMTLLGVIVYFFNGK